MNYTLIKVENNYILVSDEKIKSGDALFQTNTKNIICAIHSSDKYTHLYPKVIASLNKIDNLPTLILSDEVADVLHYVNIEMLAKEANGYLPYARDTKGIAFNEGYLEGYNRCLQDNKDRLYSAKDIVNAIEFGMNGGYGYQMGEEGETINQHKRYIQSLQPTSWEVVIDMEQPNNTLKY